jgi:FtsP/CotA-like multicopper oxidase with cupredoxin domain
LHGGLLQLGTEGGFLDGTTVPQGVTIPTIAGAVGMLLAPAERADVVIDFSKIKPGRYVILHNDAPVPYPGGEPAADFWPGNKKLAVPPAQGYGPNTRTLLQFDVIPQRSLAAFLPTRRRRSAGICRPRRRRIVVKSVQVPNSPRTGAHEYVWHCHILEHEEHDMMRPLIVTP